MAQLGRVPVHTAGDLRSNPGPGKNFSLKLTTRDQTDGYSEKLKFTLLALQASMPCPLIAKSNVRSRLEFSLFGPGPLRQTKDKSQWNYSWCLVLIVNL